MWYGRETSLTLYPHAWVPYHSINQSTINQQKDNLLYGTLGHTMTQ